MITPYDIVLGIQKAIAENADASNYSFVRGVTDSLSELADSFCKQCKGSGQGHSRWVNNAEIRTCSICDGSGEIT